MLAVLMSRAEYDDLEVRLVFTSHGWDDYLFWQRTDRDLLKRINRLLDVILREPCAIRLSPSHL